MVRWNIRGELMIRADFCVVGGSDGGNRILLFSSPPSILLLVLGTALFNNGLRYPIRPAFMLFHLGYS